MAPDPLLRKSYLLGYHAHHFQALVRVAPFVVVPAHDLHEGAVQCNASVGIKDRGAGVATEVGGHHLVFGVAQNALERAFGLGLHLGLYFFVGGSLVQFHRQVHHRHAGGGHAEGHAGQLLVQRRDHHAHRLGSTGAGGGGVFQNAAAAAPVLVRRAVHGLLRGGGSVHGGHQAALDAPLVVQHLGHGSQAVGGARCVGDDGLARVGVVVHAEHEHGGVVLGGGRQDDLLGTSVQVLLRGDLVQEQAGGFDHHVGADFVPLQVGGGALLREADLLAVGDQHRIGHVFFGETEVLEQHGRRGRFTVGVDAHHGSAAVFPPAVGHAHFHGHAGHAGGQHAALVLGVFTVEGGGAGHGDHAHADLLVGQQALGLEGQLYFRPGGDDHGHGLLLDAHVGGLAQHVGAARDVAQVALGRIGQVLARQGQHGGLVAVGQGHAPGHGGFGRVTLAPFAASVLTTLPCMSKRRLGVLLVLVRLEPVRSALPPSSSGRAAVKASSASWLALRLATVSPLVWAATTVSTATWAKLAGRSPFMRRVSSAASSGKAAV